MSDGRKTLGDISRAVNNFDRNPTRVLFGASNGSSSNAQAAQPAPAAAPATRQAAQPAPAATGSVPRRQ
jgi:phospholipid/cholesterol/gamma-HCH transport system substrate-binding protein